MPRGAGAGRPRKVGETRNRNKPTRETIVVDADARAAIVPDPVIPLTQSGQGLWDFLWSLPIASLWDQADAPAVTRMVKLQSRKGTLDAKTLAEVRQLEDRFLLNPYSRAQQRVVIEGSGAAGSDTPPADVSDIDHYRDRMERRKRRP